MSPLLIAALGLLMVATAFAGSAWPAGYCILHGGWLLFARNPAASF